MKPKHLTSAICFILLLILCGTATGESIPSGSAGKVPLADEIELKESGDVAAGKFDAALGSGWLQAPPWPVRHCDAARTGRSKFKGPGTTLLETANVDLFGGVLEYQMIPASGSFFSETLEESMQEEAFDGLVIGKGNRLYFRHKIDRVVFSYQFPDGQQLTKEEWGNSYPGLDSFSRVHGLFHSIFKIMYCIAPDGTEVWKIPVFGGGGAYSFFAVGKKIYLDAEWDKDENDETFFNMSAYDIGGNLKWTSGPYYTNFHACAEDAQGNAYFRDASPTLHRINPDGTTAWTFQFPVKTGDDFTDTGIGPICGADGRIWVSAKSTTAQLRMKAGLPYIVLNNDGSKYKSGGFGDKGAPAAACYGGDNRLYVGFSDAVVSCYNDWNEEVWSTTLVSSGDDLLDMVMDVDNNIYVAYTAWGAQTMGEGCYVSVINSTDGSVKKTQLIDIPEQWSDSPTELAIGEDRTLFLLNSAGYLKQLSALKIATGGMEKLKGN